LKKSSTYRYLLLILISIGLLAYANAVFYPFVHDDRVFIVQNPQIGQWADWYSAFQTEALNGNRSQVINTYYRPLLEILYRLQYRIFGLAPSGYHIFNILLHVANTILLWSWLRRFLTLLILPTGFILGALCFISGVFLLHPIQTEAVTCISGISNLLFVFLVLISLHGYLDLRSLPQKAGWRTWGAMMRILLSYGLALMVKEQSIMLPFLLIWLEWILSRGQEEVVSTYARKRSLICGLGVIAATVGYFVWRKLMLVGFSLPLWSFSYEFLLRIKAIPQTILMDLRMLLWPYDLHYYRSIDILEPVGFSFLWLLVVLLLTGILMDRLPREKKMVAIFAVGWFGVTLFPVLNILPLIHEYSLIAAFEHFMYLPLVGFALLVFVLAEEAGERFFPQVKKHLSMIIIGALWVTYGSLTMMQNRYWAGEIPLFERVVQHEPKLARARMLLATAYLEARRWPQAKEEFEQALSILNTYIQRSNCVSCQEVREFYQGLARDTHTNLGTVLVNLGQPVMAIEHFQMALRGESQDLEVHNRMGLAFIALQDIPSAANEFRQVLVYDPVNIMAKSNLAGCLAAQGDRQEAIRLLKEVMVQDPQFTIAQQNLDRLLAEPSP
jgi:Flp pilus assembly protein TadD